MITIIDYGLGNIKAFVNLYERLNIRTKVAHKSEDVKNAEKIILPGVGAFDYAMSQLNKSGMRDELEKQVLINKIPIVGICVGMQILSKCSEEGNMSGLSWIEGTVKKMDTSKISYRSSLPHMGWNSINPINNCQLFQNFKGEPRFYFLHSYYFECMDDADIIATTSYGLTYASAINKDNIFGIQFHPEKSHSNGIQLLLNFANL